MIGALLRSRYELSGLLAEGPVFAAYAARDRVIGRDVCIRMVKPPFSTETNFVQALSQAIAKHSVVHQAGIEAITEIDRDDSSPFLVGELSRGPSLAERIRKLAPFSVPVTVATGISICQALDAVHRLGFAHGDLQSTNIAVMADGDVRLQLTGIWEAYSASTSAGAIVVPGMAPYLAPEVSAGGMPTPQSDVYAVGILLYELLSGRKPYLGEGPVAVALQHANTPTPSIRATNPSTPSVLDEIVKKAMAKRAVDRYQNAGELLSDLRILQDHLRFGRASSWPLRAQSGAKSEPEEAPRPVAPKMSAIRVDADERENRSERDVPVWLIVILTFLSGVVLSLLIGWLYFNLNKPRLIPVPTLTGLTFTEARQQLESSGLHIRIGSKEPSESIDADHIIDSDPAAQTRVPQGGTIRVVVSQGSRMVAVPDLKGSTLDGARTILGNLSLQLDPEVGKLSVPTAGADEIVRQSPPPNARVERSSRVKVFVNDVTAPPDTAPPASADGTGSGNQNAGPPPGTSSPDTAGDQGSSTTSGDTTPSDSGDTTDSAGETDSRRNSGKYLYTLNIHVGALPLHTLVSVTMKDSQGLHQVLAPQELTDQNIKIPTTGTGRRVEFRVYYGSVLVKRVIKNAETNEP